MSKKSKVRKVITTNLSQKIVSTFMSETSELKILVYNLQTGKMLEKQGRELTLQEHDLAMEKL